MNFFHQTIATQSSYVQQKHCATCRCPPNASDSPNLYLSPFTQTSSYREPLIMTFNPRKNMFMQTSPARTDLSNSQSKVNVTFNYTSPIIIKKCYSSEGKFNTKSFKYKKFPHFNDRMDKEEPVLQICKKIDQPPSKIRIRNLQKTPQKHPLLKMKKIKNAKSQEGRSLKSSNSLNIFSNPSSNGIATSQLNQQDIAYKFHTPINHLEDKQFTPNRPIVAERDYKPQIKHKKEIKEQKNDLEIKQSKQPTVKSIDIYQHVSTPEEDLEIVENIYPSLTSLNMEYSRAQASDLKKLGLIQASDREIGMHISEQLALNYDYFSLLQQSDRSLSLQVEL